MLFYLIDLDKQLSYTVHIFCRILLGVISSASLSQEAKLKKQAALDLNPTSEHRSTARATPAPPKMDFASELQRKIKMRSNE